MVQPASAGINTLTRVGPYGGSVSKVAFHPTNSSIAYATTTAGFHRSTDGGQSWQLVNDRIFNTARDLTVHPSQPDRVFVVTSGPGVLASNDAGATLSVLGSSTGIYASGTDVEYSADGTVVYVSTGRQVYRSTDHGTTWLQGGDIPVDQYMADNLIVDPTDSSRLYMVGEPGQGFQSADGGVTWQSWSVPNALINDLAIADLQQPAPRIWAATTNGIRYSDDRGVSWTIAYSGISLTVTVDPDDPTIVYAGAFEGLLRSEDNGDTWSNIQGDAITGGLQSLAIDPQNTNIVYAGGDNFMARSVDGGATWQQLWYDQNRFLDSRTATVDPLRPHSLYVGINGNGIREFSVQPDLRIAEIASDVVGTAASYSYRISNAGPFDATNVRTRIELPRGSTNIAATSPGAACTVADTVVTCAAPIFRTDASTDITITATHTVAGDLRVVGTIEGDQPDAASADNSVTTNVASTEMADLSVTLTAPAFVTRGDQINLSMKVTNAGPTEAAVVSIRLELGAGLIIANVSLAGGTSTPIPGALGTCVIAGNTLSCRLPQLPSGGSYTIGIVTHATTSSGSFGHIALVESSGADLGLRNNSASAATTVRDPGNGGGGGGGGSTSPFMIAALLLLASLRRHIQNDRLICLAEAAAR